MISNKVSQNSLFTIDDQKIIYLENYGDFSVNFKFDQLIRNKQGRSFMSCPLSESPALSSWSNWAENWMSPYFIKNKEFKELTASWDIAVIPSLRTWGRVTPYQIVFLIGIAAEVVISDPFIWKPGEKLTQTCPDFGIVTN